MSNAELFRLMYLVVGPLAVLALGGAVYWIATRKAH